MEKLTGNMRAAFKRPTCGFYDSIIRSGGPDPNPELRPNMKPRNPVRPQKHLRERRRADRNRDIMLKYRKGAPLAGLQDILLGYRYWTERYINECHGQRGYQYIANKGQKYVRNRQHRYHDFFHN